jgi:hypothetical protein
MGGTLTLILVIVKSLTWRQKGSGSRSVLMVAASHCTLVFVNLADAVGILSIPPNNANLNSLRLDNNDYARELGQ